MVFYQTGHWYTRSDTFFQHNSSPVFPQISNISDCCKDAEGQNKIRMILSTVEIRSWSDIYLNTCIFFYGILVVWLNLNLSVYISQITVNPLLTLITVALNRYNGWSVLQDSRACACPDKASLAVLEAFTMHFCCERKRVLLAVPEEHYTIACLCPSLSLHGCRESEDAAWFTCGKTEPGWST